MGVASLIQTWTAGQIWLSWTAKLLAELGPVTDWALDELTNLQSMSLTMSAVGSCSSYLLPFVVCPRLAVWIGVAEFRAGQGIFSVSDGVSSASSSLAVTICQDEITTRRADVLGNNGRGEGG